MAARFQLKLETDPPQSGGALGDWYGNLFNVGRQRLVLCQSARTLLPVILPARNGEFPRRFPEYLAEVLFALKMPSEAVRREHEAAQEWTFAATNSRSILGAMNDFAFCGSHDIDAGRSLLETSLRLSEMPTKPLSYSCAERETRALLESARA